MFGIVSLALLKKVNNTLLRVDILAATGMLKLFMLSMLGLVWWDKLGTIPREIGGDIYIDDGDR